MSTDMCGVKSASNLNVNRYVLPLQESISREILSQESDFFLSLYALKKSQPEKNEKAEIDNCGDD